MRRNKFACTLCDDRYCRDRCRVIFPSIAAIGGWGKYQCCRRWLKNNILVMLTAFYFMFPISDRPSFSEVRPSNKKALFTPDSIKKPSRIPINILFFQAFFLLFPDRPTLLFDPLEMGNIQLNGNPLRVYSGWVGVVRNRSLVSTSSKPYSICTVASRLSDPRLSDSLS